MTVTAQHTDTLKRFHVAQAQRGIYNRARSEIMAGRKRSHWMWFVFPQLSALAKSETAQYYGITDKAEAAAYIDDPVLRTRLAECTMGVLSHRRLMFSHPDNGKLQASMTLFRTVVADPALPNAVLSKFYDGKPHQLTLDVLAGKAIPPQMTAMGRVEVGRHWDKQTRQARANVAAVGARPSRTDPMIRAEVASFVSGFGLSGAATRRIVDAWMADQDRAREAGWESHADSVYYDG